MKPLYYLTLILLLAAASCNDGPVEEKEPEGEPESVAPMNSEEFMNAYVDSINVMADSLQKVYNSILDLAPRNMDSAKLMMAAHSPRVAGIKSELDRINQEIGILIEKKWISEEDYQIMFHEIHLTNVQASEQTLAILGLHFDSARDSSEQTN